MIFRPYTLRKWDIVVDISWAEVMAWESINWVMCVERVDVVVSLLSERLWGCEGLPLEGGTRGSSPRGSKRE